MSNIIITTAWKNVWRNKLRSSIVIVAVTIGIFGGLFASAVMEGASKQRIRSAIENETSHIQIHQEDFLDNTEMELTIPNRQQKVNEIAGNTEVTSVSARLKITAMAKTAKTGSGVIVSGVNPDSEKEISGLNEEIPDSLGTYLTEEKKRVPQMVIGQELAKKLGSDVGSKIILNFQESGGDLTGGAFRVCGIYSVSNSIFEETHIFVKRKVLRELAGIPNNEVHEIAVLLRNSNLTDKITNRLQDTYPELSVLSWKEITPSVGLIAKFMDLMLFVVMIIILLALAFGIVNTMLMVVLERVKELGMLMAIGMNRLRVFIMIMYETIFLSLVGGIIGILISFGVINYYSHAGIDLTSLAEGLESVGYSAFIYPELSTGFYFSVGGLIVLTAIISSVYPAVKALKLNPADAIRMEN